MTMCNVTGDYQCFGDTLCLDFQSRWDPES